MSGRPDYFEPIRQRASQRWDQLEKDPELAGPWHQLFKQVQSPRHILSELLQNADDAGATEASVQVEDGRFVFAHNGEDFTEEHFGSLCRFGYSNKRALHTIGFRGIGFKSTFSLGGSVELHTPTLSVAFSEKRFTEPSWIERAPTRAGHTTVIAVIRDSHRQREVEKNLQEWISSPVSLLFFRSIRRLRIDDKQVYWKSQGTGPIPNTEWMAIHEDPEQRFLVAQSAAEPFPADALTEIRQERMLGDGQDSDFPPCKVEVVLGAKGRLYVVLPTGVETSLPFACNAPFIQDPARLKVKDPETSPTNRWLLERVGALAASVMQKWLEENSASLSERSQAYGFFPDVGRDDDSLDGTCAAIVQTAFDAATKGKTYVLTNDGELTTIRQSIAIPEELFDVWPEGQATALLDRAHRPAFSRSVPERAQARLVRRGVVDKVDKNQILNMLQENHLPKPGNWRALLKLWSYVAPDITGYRKLAGTRDIRIFPVQGKDVLHSATEIVRLGEKRLLQTDEDWDFLAAHLLVLNQNWPRFLAEQRREAEERGDNKLLQEVDAAYAIFGTCGLEAASDVKSVIDQVARDFFGGGPIRLPDCVRLTQIAAKLGAAVEGSFRFVTRDNKLRNLEHVVLFDSDGTLEAMLPEAWCAAHLLHPDYSKTFESCSRDDWVGWIQSGRAGLHTCMPLLQVESTVWGRSDLGTELTRREIASSPYYHYVTSQFRLEDWDFEESLWHYWTVLSKEDAQLWPRLVERLLLQPEAFWSKARKARALQVATTNRLAAVTNDPLLPAWILKLRELPCLRDTRGFCRNPAELLRRTPETESLMDVEAFIHGQFDTEAVRPLLKLLGVRDIPTGPARLLDCLRALSRSDSPPSHEVDKWYRRLDRMLETCSTNDFSVVKMALRDERLILTEAGGWSSGASAFLSSDEEDVPGAATVRASVRDLMLWRKVGIAERPTAELAIAWLGKLPSGEVLSQNDSRRVQSLLGRHAGRIWIECSHWLNLAGEWAPVETLKYAVSMQTLVSWKHLHVWVRQQTADFQRLSSDITGAWPFSGLLPLASLIDDRFERELRSVRPLEKRLWSSQFGGELRRIVLDDEAEQQRIRDTASDLAASLWQIVPSLETVPYIDGTPAGTATRVEVLWLDRVIYVEELSNAKLARLVPDKLGRRFARPDITAALNYCFGRSAADVTEYLEENFKLASREEPITGGLGNDDFENDVPPPSIGGGNPPATQNTGEQVESTGKSGEKIATEVEGVRGEPEVTEDPVEDQIEPNGSDEKREQPREPAKPTKPANTPIIERFARSEGFRKDGDSRFYHADGGWIGKTNGGAFPWERWNANGELVSYYLPKDHCLEIEPLQLDATAWGLLNKFPETYALVLSDAQDRPVEVSGARLHQLREAGSLTLFPATYRLVFDHDRQK